MPKTEFSSPIDGARNNAPPMRTLPRFERQSRHYPTAWPKIGGAGLQTGPTNVFLSEEFRDRFKPGEKRRAYAGACPGLAVVSHSIALPNYKISTCGFDRLQQRFFELNRDGYAAWRYVNGVLVRQDGFNAWFPTHLYPTVRPSPNSPVVADARSILITLPDSLSAKMFDEKFDALTRLGAIDAWSMTEDGRQHCAALGVDSDELRRHTVYPGWVTSPAWELCGFSTYSGADRLIAICEQILADHIGVAWTPALR
ncbi:hypothetical protein [Rhodoblastus sp.]|uniref:hypothetical protein n=2 Tax=Rhodoblastus sp. TaxID=1962975 RepID=UPI003F9EAA4A